MEVEEVGRVLLILLLYVVVLVGPWVAALRLRPVPFDAPFPTPREITALVIAAVLLPAASYLTASSGYLSLLVGPIMTTSVCVFIAAIVGRRPFVYTTAMALLHLVGFLLWLPKTTGRAFDYADRASGRLEGVPYLLIFVVIALVCGGIAGLFLFGLWKSDEKAPAN